MTKTNAQTATAANTNKALDRAKRIAAEAAAARKAGQPEKVVAAIAKGKKVITAEDLGGTTSKPKLASGKAQMARGIGAGQAPHSAKAIADQGTKAKASNKADAATQKPAKAAKPVKVGKVAVEITAAGNRSTKGIVSTRNGDQKIVVVAKASPYKPGSKADETFALFAKAGTVDGFKALVAKNPGKYDAGYIRYSARDGYIKVG